MIYVECKPDTVMMKTLSSGDEVRHLYGKSSVCSKLARETDCRGMVDEDTSHQKHPYITGLKELGAIRTDRRNDLIICQDMNRRNRLILLRPRLEEWVAKSARMSGISLKSYSLSDDPEELRDLLYLGDNRMLNRFRMVIQKLRNCSSRVQTLAVMIN